MHLKHIYFYSIYLFSPFKTNFNNDIFLQDKDVASLHVLVYMYIFFINILTKRMHSVLLIDVI